MRELRFITPPKGLVCPVITKTFPAGKARSASLTLTGLGLYRAYLNGKRVGDDYLSPGLNDYTAYLRAQSHDITGLLQAENTLEIFLGDGWYRGRYGLDGASQKRETYGSQYLLAANVSLTDENGQEQLIQTDDSWLVGPSPIVMSDIYDGEHRDDTRAREAGLPCQTAQAPGPVEMDSYPQIRVRTRLKPKLLRSKKGEHILDFGQNLAGVVRFVNRLEKGKTLRLLFGEVLQEGCFYRENLRSAKAEYVYTSDGLEKEVEPWFTFYGFRYVLVEGLEEVNPEDFTALVLSSDMAETLRLTTSSEKINQLIQNTLWSQRGNFIDVPTDCPQRDERLGWTGDAQVFCGTACFLMDSKVFFDKFLRDLRYEQTTYYDGDIPMYSPSLKGEAGAGGAAWADAATIIPWTLYAQYGDKEQLSKHYPLMRDFADKLLRVDLKEDSANLVTEGFAFGDWLGLDGISPTSFVGGTDKPFIQSVYCMHSLNLAATAAEVLGQSSDAERFSQASQRVRNAIQENYFTPAGRLSVDTQTAYALALYHRLYTDLDVLKTQFKNRLRLDSYRLNTGFVGTGIILPALLDHGLVDEAFRLLMREDYPGWFYPVTMGATTIWERWNSLMPDGTVSDTGMNSFNHYASGAVCETLITRIAGLQSAAPGWQAARIAPRPHWKLKEMDLAFDSPAGTYQVAWQLQDDLFTLDVTVPKGARADIHLPGHPDGVVHQVGEGQYHYAYNPTHTLSRPFSATTMAADLMGNEAAQEALQQHMPGFFGGLKANNPDFLMMSPLEAQNTLPFLRHSDIDGLDKALTTIRA